jgi:hypothetical protein
MPLELHRITSESDLTDFVHIQLSAFASGSGIVALLTPRPLPSAYVQKAIGKHIKSFREDVDVTYLKVIDTDLNGKMIAGAKWRINEKERTEEEILSMLPAPGEDERGNQGAVDFMAFLSRVRRQYMGTRPVYCTFLKLCCTLLIDCELECLTDLSSSAYSCDRPGASSQRRRSHAAQLGS